MIIKKEQGGNKKPQVDVSGPSGNAYKLFAMAKRLCRQLDMDFEPIRAEMASGDYENLVAVFDKHFGEYVDVVRD